MPIVGPVATAINQSIDSLIHFLEQRRAQLLRELRDTREEMGANQVARQQMKQQITETRAFLESQMTHNELQTMQERIVADSEAKMAQLQTNGPPLQEVRFLCDTRNLEKHIAFLGEIVRLDILPIPTIPEIPNYAALQQPIVAVGKERSAPGELKWPRGVAIELESGDIYVPDLNNSRIQIFSQKGEYLNQYTHQSLTCPYGILIHQDKIYVTDLYHTIFLLKLPDLTMIKRVRKEGSGNKEFNKQRQLAISPNQLLYVADTKNNRLQIMCTNLVFLGSLRHQTMTRPVDIKFSNNEIFVLSLSVGPHTGNNQ